MNGPTEIIGDLANGRFRNFTILADKTDSLDDIMHRIADKYSYTNNCYTLHVATPITVKQLKNQTGCQDVVVVPKRCKKESSTKEMALAKRIDLAAENYQRKIRLGKKIHSYITEKKISSNVLERTDKEALKIYMESEQTWRKKSRHSIWSDDGDFKVVPRRRILPEIRKRSRSEDNRRTLFEDIFSEEPKVGIDDDVKVGFATRKRSRSEDSKRDICSAGPKPGLDIDEGLDRYECLTDLSKRNVVISE